MNRVIYELATELSKSYFDKWDKKDAKKYKKAITKIIKAASAGYKSISISFLGEISRVILQLKEEGFTIKSFGTRLIITWGTAGPPELFPPKGGTGEVSK